MEDQNNTNFPLQVKEFLSKQKLPKDEFLQYHQYILLQYVKNMKNMRGILIQWEMGRGKSISAASISHHYRSIDPTRNIFVLMAKGLTDNFKNNIKKYLEKSENMSTEEAEKEIKNKYNFVSLNSSNMFNQLIKDIAKKSSSDFEKQMGTLAEKLQDVNLENIMLIIDEAHHFFNGITNGSENAIKLYDIIMKTKNIKLIFLTGTPMINSPFELVPCFNMLKGMLRRNNTLFPEIEEEFKNYFIDETKVKNKHIFQNRILGYVSYYGSKHMNKQSEFFPEIKDRKIIKIKMSKEQYSKYLRMKNIEAEESRSSKKKSGRFSSKSGIFSSYRIKSRQVCNFYLPDKYDKSSNDKVNKSSIINKMPKDFFEESSLKKYNPKMYEVLMIIKSNKGRSGYVGTDFVGTDITALSIILELQGYKRFIPEKVNSNYEYDVEKQKINKDEKSKGKIYAVITGNIPFKERTEITEIYNSKENIEGDIISVVIVSKAGMTGIELHNSGYVVLLGSLWNMSSIEQLISRGSRYKSHINLPKSKQFIQPYILLSDHMDGASLENKESKTTDVDIYLNAVKGGKMINKFSDILIESSIDCTVHNINNKYKCLLCSPDGKKLYQDEIAKDFRIPNRCKELKKEKIKVKEIYVKELDKKFYYLINNKSPLDVKIYEYDDSLKGYQEMKSDNEYKSYILESIINNLKP